MFRVVPGTTAFRAAGQKGEKMLSREDIRRLAIIATIAAVFGGLLILSRSDLRTPEWCDARSNDCFDKLTERLK